jgi:hypothetical protein
MTSGFDNQRANSASANENKRKQNGFLLLPFISFYFSESGLFKGLRPKEIKKFSPVAARPAGCGWSVSNSRGLSPPGRRPGA